MPGLMTCPKPSVDVPIPSNLLNSHHTNTHTHPGPPSHVCRLEGSPLAPKQCFAAQAKVYMNTLPLPGNNPYPAKKYSHRGKNTKSTLVDQKKACHKKHFSAFKSTHYVPCISYMPYIQ